MSQNKENFMSISGIRSDQTCIVMGKDTTVTSKVWKGFVNVKAPDGRYIPVDNPVNYYPSNSEMSDTCDRRDSVVCEGRSPAHHLHDFGNYRAVDNFDYSEYGFVKIGHNWVDASNKVHVDEAQKIDKQFCVIL